MKTLLRVLLPVCVLALLAAAGASAADEAASSPATSDKIAVPTSVGARETREYKANVSVKGKMPSPDEASSGPIDLDASYSLLILHRYARREGDGLLPLEISVKDGEIVANGQRLSVSPGVFPKLTVLLDRDWQITDVFGARNEDETARPGISYDNLIILFYLRGGDKPHAIGETWQSKVRVPSTQETYDFTNTLQSIGEVDGVKVAVVRQEIRWAPKQRDGSVVATTTAVAESSFALDNGKLIRSKVDCNVLFNSGKSTASRQDQPASRANIKIDVSLVR